MAVSPHRAFCALWVVIICACSAGQEPGTRRTIFDSRDSEDPRSLDPAYSTDVPTGRAVGYLFDGLTRFTADARLEPGLARSWDISDDGLTYLFHLRSGVMFHDGTLFSAADVVRSFERVLNPATRAGRVWPLHPIAGAVDFTEGRAASVAGLRIVDDTTVSIRLETPLAVFPKLLAMPLAHIVPAVTPEGFGERPVGTGPWKLVEWRHDDYILFARNDQYFDGAPAADSLRARIIPEPSTAVAEFESGNVDVLAVPEAETARWRGDPERAALLQSIPALRLWYVALNTGRGPLANEKVRRALNHALDIDAILAQLLGGRGKRAAGVIPPTLEGADASRQPYARDTAVARQLLADAGHPSGIDLELWHSTNPTSARIAQAVQGYLSEVGVRARLIQRDAASVREAAYKGEVDMFVKDWFADYPDAENFLFPLLHGSNTGAGGNVSFFRNAIFDSLVAASRRTSDSTVRLSLYRKADSLAFAQAPMIFLFFAEDLFAVQPWLRGFQVPAIFNGQRWTDATIVPPDP
jgi:peptide/nickel transport system substrate-binding protein/oligopeptide transport system substrate-binding protein